MEKRQQSVLFNCYLAALQQTLGHSQEGSRTKLMLITVFLYMLTWRSPGA